MSPAVRRARIKILQAMLKKIASFPPDHEFSRSEMCDLSVEEIAVSGSPDWAFRAFRALSTLGHIYVIPGRRHVRLTPGAAPKLLALAARSDLDFLWARNPRTAHDPASEDAVDEERAGEERAGEEDEEEDILLELIDDDPPPREAASAPSLEEKVEMVLQMLPAIAARLGEVAEALRSHGVSPDLREAILDSRRILKGLE